MRNESLERARGLSERNLSLDALTPAIYAIERTFDTIVPTLHALTRPGSTSRNRVSARSYLAQNIIFIYYL